MASLVTVTLAFVTFMQAAPAKAPDPKAHAAVLMAAMTAQDFARVEAEFDDKMKAALPPGRLAVAWASLVAQAGAFKSCGADVRVRTISEHQMVITPCEFERAKIDVQFAFDPDNHVSGLVMRPAASTAPYTPPAYATPSTYTEGDVTVGSGEWALPGTLTTPAGAGPFPAVVLVHGSGPNDRDETIGPNKPFKDLALGLASRGVAVLRYEKRTKEYGAKMAGMAGMTVKDEVLDDAAAAAATLRSQPRIDPARVFVLGHSLGGMLVPRIAAADQKLAGVIVMAGAARPLDRAILEQITYLAKADGTVTPEEQKAIDDAQQLVDAVAALKPSDASGTTPVGNAPPSYWLDLRGYDAPSAAQAVKAPMLILQGERDYQVTPAEFARWRDALAGRRDVTFHSYPALNHLFIAGTGKSLPAEYGQASHVAEDVVNDIAAWVKR
jgi:dienelactone hydrolase